MGTGSNFAAFAKLRACTLLPRFKSYRLKSMTHYTGSPVPPKIGIAGHAEEGPLGSDRSRLVAILTPIQRAADKPPFRKPHEISKDVKNRAGSKP
jgi:hypothetical protein